MAWYDDNKRMTYVATYKNDKEMRKDVEQAAKHGFVPQHQTGQSAMEGGLIGAFGVTLGSATTRHSFTLSYVRDPRWLVRQRLEEVRKPLAKLERAATNARGDASQRALEVERLLAAQVALTAVDGSGESQLLKAFQQLSRARTDAQKKLESFRVALDSAWVAEDAATNIGVSLDSTPYPRDMGVQLRAEMHSHAQRNELESRLARAQEELVRQIGEVDKWQGRLQEALRRVEQARGDVAAKEAAEHSLGQGAAETEHASEQPPSRLSFLRRLVATEDPRTRSERLLQQARVKLVLAEGEQDEARRALDEATQGVPSLIESRNRLAAETSGHS